MGFREDSFGLEGDPNARNVADYVRRQRIARGEIEQNEFPICGDCQKRHSPHYDCGK